MIIEPLKGSRITREFRKSVAKNKPLTTQASLNHVFVGIHDPSKYKKQTARCANINITDKDL